MSLPRLVVFELDHDCCRHHKRSSTSARLHVDQFIVLAPDPLLLQAQSIVQTSLAFRKSDPSFLVKARVTSGRMSYQHVNAPEAVLEWHLKRHHGKTSSWMEDHPDVRSAHREEHDRGRADHNLNDLLHY